MIQSSGNIGIVSRPPKNGRSPGPGLWLYILINLITMSVHGPMGTKVIEMLQEKQSKTLQLS